MNMQIVTPPSLKVLSLAEAKDFLRVTHDDEDALIEGMVSAATSMAQTETGRQLLTCTRKLMLDSFPGSNIILPYAPVQSVTHVKYIDTSGMTQTMTVDTDYKVNLNDEEMPYIYLPYGVTWPSVYGEPGSVEIQYVCGWTSADEVPEAIRQWVRIAVSTMYEHREQFIATGTVNAVTKDFLGGLLDPYRIVRIA